jgi:AcrR family transcriptional regulator
MVKKVRTSRATGTVRAAGGRTSFDLMWSVPAKSTRGPRPKLSLDAILQAAIAMADAEGLDALTMAGLAQRLRVAPMALYRHVPGKQELIELMSERALGPPPAADDGDWRDAIGRWARANLESLVARPWLIEAVSRRRTPGPNLMGWLDSALAALARSGLPDSRLIEGVLLIDGHARSTAQLLTGAPATPEWADNFGRALQASRGDLRYATLNRLAEAGTLAPAEEQIPFEFGLQRILDGIEVFVASGARTPSPRPSRRTR